MERIALAVLDGSRCVDKLVVKKDELNKDMLDATMSDCVMVVSNRVAKFLEKYT